MEIFFDQIERIKDSVHGIAIIDENIESRYSLTPLTVMEQLTKKYNNILMEINCDSRDINVIIANIYSAHYLGIETITLFSEKLDLNLETLLNAVSEVKSDLRSDVSRICFGLSFNEIIDNPALLYNLKITGFDFILIPENYEPSIFIPIIQEGKSLGLSIFVKLSIFLNAQEVKFAQKFLNLNIPDKLLKEMEKADNPLDVSLKYAKEYIDFLKILEIDGLFLILPQNEKNFLIKKELFNYTR